MFINTNVSALFAENAVQNTTSQMSTVQQQLATGLAINSPANNPAGLAITDLMAGELGGMTAANQNANQAVNLLQTAAGGIQSDIATVQQIQQLAVQASNGTQTSQDQQDIQSQINSLLTQLDNTASSTNYNSLAMLNGQFGASVQGFTGSSAAVANVVLGPDSGSAQAGAYTVTITSVATGQMQVVIANASGATVAAATVAASGSQDTVQLVQGTGAVTGASASFVITFNAASIGASSTGSASAAFTVAAASKSLNFQVGANQGSADQVSAALGSFTSTSLGLNAINVVGQSNAQAAITLAQGALSMLTNANGAVGAQQDALQVTLNNLGTESQNLQAARSTILDANMAQVASSFAKLQVLQQTGLQQLAVDNQLPGTIAKILGL